MHSGCVVILVLDVLSLMRLKAFIEPSNSRCAALFYIFAFSYTKLTPYLQPFRPSTYVFNLMNCRTTELTLLIFAGGLCFHVMASQK